MDSNGYGCSFLDVLLFSFSPCSLNNLAFQIWFFKTYFFFSYTQAVLLMRIYTSWLLKLYYLLLIWFLILSRLPTTWPKIRQKKTCFMLLKGYSKFSFFQSSSSCLRHTRRPNLVSERYYENCGEIFRNFFFQDLYLLFFMSIMYNAENWKQVLSYNLKKLFDDHPLDIPSLYCALWHRYWRPWCSYLVRKERASSVVIRTLKPTIWLRQSLTERPEQK